MRKRTLALTAGTAVAAAGLAAGSWAVLTPAEAESSTSCDVAFLEVSTEREGDATELDLELTSNTPGETWSIRVEHDGRVVHESDRVTDAEAEVELELRSPGTSEGFTVVATPADGSPCTITVPRD